MDREISADRTFHFGAAFVDCKCIDYDYRAQFLFQIQVADCLENNSEFYSALTETGTGSAVCWIQSRTQPEPLWTSQSPLAARLNGFPGSLTHFCLGPLQSPLHPPSG